MRRGRATDQPYGRTAAESDEQLHSVSRRKIANLPSQHLRRRRRSAAAAGHRPAGNAPDISCTQSIYRSYTLRQKTSHFYFLNSFVICETLVDLINFWQAT